MSPSRKLPALAAVLALAGTGLAVVAADTAVANPSGTGLVISEAYGGGGNSGATWKNDFVELYNPTSAAISVAGMSVQYRSSGSSSAASGVTPLTGSVPAGGHYLVAQAAGTGGTDDLPTADATGTTAMSGSAFQTWLADGTTALNPPVGEVAGTAGIIDFVGVNASSFEGAKTGGTSNTTSAARNATGTDTDNNLADFTVGTAITPTNAAGETGGEDPEPPAAVVDATIAEVQGTGFQSPFADSPDTYVSTEGVVTAVYGTAGFHSYVIQTEGTGGAADATPGASDGLAVQQEGGAIGVAIGDFVAITGPVVEEFGVTKLTWDPANPFTGLVDISAQAHTDPVALVTDYPTTSADREAHESELLDVSGQDFTVSETYPINQYSEIGLATGNRPLVTPTELADAQDPAAIDAVEDDNYVRGVILDDGADVNYMSGANQDVPLPWLSPTNPIRVGAAADVTGPVVLDYQFGAWRFQPTERVTDEGADVATFQNTRPANATPQDVGGDLELATFNVLNYFNTTGVDWVGSGHTCTFFDDRDGDPVTNNTCSDNGPRGAAEDEDLTRQQDKIVTAINTLDADIVSLEEIENSVTLGEDRDDALQALVAALNTAAGETRWAFPPSPAPEDLPATAEQDVIRTAFIYDPDTVDTVGASKVLVGSAAFANAREPLAQAFKAEGDEDVDAFGVIVNHFKSKGSGVDDGTGQGNANPDRIAQAQDLVTFADAFQAERGISKMFLTGDFNSYSMEDPIQVLEAAGYTNLRSDFGEEYSYNFDGMDGSLDHVLANAAALPDVTGVDIWRINSPEALAFEYSRHNYNVTDFYAPDQFRASDHDPEIVGIDVPGADDGAETRLRVKATPKRVWVDRTRVKLHITVKGHHEKPTGEVEVLVPGQGVLTGTLRNGKVTFRLAEFDTPGIRQIEVTYSGDDAVQGATETIEIEVDKHKSDKQH